MMTKKRITLMIIMIVVLIAVAAALVLLLSKTPAQQEAQSSLIVVAETDTADVVGLDFASGGDVTSLVKNDGLWYYSGNISGTVDQLLTESTVTYLSYMYADSIARQSVDDLSPYGLD